MGSWEITSSMWLNYILFGIVGAWRHPGWEGGGGVLSHPGFLYNLGKNVVDKSVLWNVLLLIIFASLWYSYQNLPFVWLAWCFAINNRHLRFQVRLIISFGNSYIDLLLIQSLFTCGEWTFSYSL